VGVCRNDEVRVRTCSGWASGPSCSRPGRAAGGGGISVEVVRRLGPVLPVLGICLGHQAIAEAYGGRVVRATRPLHGTATLVRHDGRGPPRGLPNLLVAARYHSLVVDPRDRPRARHHGAVGRGRGDGDPPRPTPRRGRPVPPREHLTPVGPALLAAFLRRAGLRPGRRRGSCAERRPRCPPRAPRVDSFSPCRPSSTASSIRRATLGSVLCVGLDPRLDLCRRRSASRREPTWKAQLYRFGAEVSS